MLRVRTKKSRACFFAHRAQSTRCTACNRPYALTSCLHNNDAMLGVKLRARVVLAERIGAQPLSQCAGQGQSGGIWHAEVGPLAACLAMVHVAVPHLTPNAAGRPSVMSYE